MHALIAGIATIVLIVVATDQLIWRPLIAWSEKFKFEQVEAADQVASPILSLLQRSKLVGVVTDRLRARVEEPIYRRLARSRGASSEYSPLDTEEKRKPSPRVSWVAGDRF